ncbi:hypothetical protein KB206_00730 [Microvirga sp. STS02]|uniref:hypothetical protein n=1 Tax=Hymenobacter negativus TaxID=2795026 RepID=UPI0018DB2556|nr:MULTISPECIES: hypothetical protein [Bacteria]MBH8567391.1 hypothetical protein [Hymenobacter negativus]MBR7207123.1 hypothetical protein [Microvirga sp. STS02]
MKDSRNLARIIINRRQGQVPLLDFEAGEKVKENRLVSALAEGKETTRNQLVRTLYDQPSAKNDNAFRQLHSRVFGKLLNHLYFLDHSDPRFSVSRRYQLECLDLLHKGLILYQEGASALSARVCASCMAKAMDDGFTAYAIEAAQQLRTIYAEMQEVKKFRAVVKDLERLQGLRRLEEQAEAIYAEARLARTGPVARLATLLATLKLHLEQVRQLHAEAQTPATADLYYRMQMIYLEQSGDYQGIIDLTLEAERQLARGQFNAHRFDVRFNLFMRMYAYLLTQQPEKGLEVASEAEKHFHPTAVNWMYFEEHRLLLALHAGQFDLARRVVQRAHLSPVFERQNKRAQQRWELFGAYLDFVRPSGKPSAARRRELGRLALMMPEYSRDKCGLNVAILIGQVLYFLREQDAEAVVLRVESLRKYRLRHLREPTNQRTRLFLRLLQLISDEQFDPVRCAERAGPFLQQLANTPPPGEAFAEVEIIPYPLLWGIILEHLRTSPPVLKLVPDATA